MSQSWNDIKHKFSPEEHEEVKREAAAELVRLGAVRTSRFTADAIEDGLRRDMPATLRALADAIESGKIDGAPWNMQASGMTGANDPHHSRMIILLTLKLSVDLLKRLE